MGREDGCTLGKKEVLNHCEPGELEVLSWQEVGGMRGVAVKSLDNTQNADFEGSIPAPD